MAVCASQVIGVHGKPGMAATAAVLEKTTLVVAFGVPELSVLLCNLKYEYRLCHRL